MIDRITAHIGPDARALPFLRFLLTCDTHVSTVKQLRGLALSENGFASRFTRATLPTPRVYLNESRLLRLHAVLQLPIDLNEAARRMKCSSQNALGRFVRIMTGQTATTWRLTPTAHVENRFMAQCIVGHESALRSFDPWAFAVRRADPLRRAASDPRAGAGGCGLREH